MGVLLSNVKGKVRGRAAFRGLGLPRRRTPE